LYYFAYKLFFAFKLYKLQYFDDKSFVAPDGEIDEGFFLSADFSGFITNNKKPKKKIYLMK
jgi:hypothetical protein